jgi:hypothetical protein
LLWSVNGTILHNESHSDIEYQFYEIKTAEGVDIGGCYFSILKNIMTTGNFLNGIGVLRYRRGCHGTTGIAVSEYFWKNSHLGGACHTAGMFPDRNAGGADNKSYQTNYG